MAEGDAEGTVAGLIDGGGGDGTLAALPMPLGSLTEPLKAADMPGRGNAADTGTWAGHRYGSAAGRSGGHDRTVNHSSRRAFALPGANSKTGRVRFIVDIPADCPPPADGNNPQARSLSSRLDVPKEPNPLHCTALLWSNPD